MLIAALTVAASAALPPAQPPAPTMSGVRISWPVKTAETAVEPGTTLAVRVRSSNRRSRVSFARVDASGRSIKVIARRTLRTGTFSVKVPSTMTRARYALRIEIAGRKRFSWVTTPAPVAAPAPAPVPAAATPVPSLTTTPPSMCGGRPDRPHSAFKGVLELGATQIQAGQSLPYALRNVGQYELLDNETYELVADPPTGYGYGAGSKYTPVEPGATAAHMATVPADTTPGRYRIVHSITVNAACDAISPVAVLSEPFDVLAP